MKIFFNLASILWMKLSLTMPRQQGEYGPHWIAYIPALGNLVGRGSKATEVA